MFVTVFILILCVLVAVWSWMRPRYPSPPLYPGVLPIIGHAHLLIGDGSSLYKRIQDMSKHSLESGGVIEFRIGTSSGYVITDPDDSLLVANKCLDKPYIYSFAKEMFNNGLFTSSVPVWKINRKQLNPVFNQQVLNSYMDEYNAQARNLVSVLSSKVGEGPFDIHRDLIEYGTKTISRTTLGLKSEDQCIFDTVYVEACEELFYIFFKRIRTVWLHPSSLFNMTSLKTKQNKVIKIKKDIINGVIDKRKIELKAKTKSENDDDSTPGKFKPLLDQLLDSSENQDGYTTEEIVEHLATFVVGAYDTTASLLNYSLLVIGSNPDVQENIYNELQEVLGDQDKDLTKEDMSKLVYLEAVIKETLRLYPSAPLIARLSDRDIKLKNYILPAGYMCFISLYGINRHPMWGADANQFRPERWLDPATLPDNPNAFASFSLGRRNCIGKLYAMMSVKTALAYFLRRYHVTSDVSKLVSQWEVVLKPVAGNHVSLTLRE